MTIKPASATAVAMAFTIHLPKAFQPKINPYSTSLNSAAFSDTRCDDDTIRFAPDKLEPERVKSQDEIDEENRVKAEKAKNREAAILANLK